MVAVWPWFCLLALATADTLAQAEADEVCQDCEEASDDTAMLQQRGHLQQKTLVHSQASVADDTSEVGSTRMAKANASVVAMNFDNSTKPRRRKLMPDRKRNPQSEGSCKELRLILARTPFMREILGLWRYLCSHGIRDHMRKLGEGCLYLPDDLQMHFLYQNVDHPNPWHFVDMVEDSFFPLKDGKCPTDVDGASAQSLEGTAVTTCKGRHGFQGTDGNCIPAHHIGTAKNSKVEVFKLGGLLGLDQTWQEIVLAMHQRAAGGENAKGAKEQSNRWTDWLNPFYVVGQVQEFFGGGSTSATPAPTQPPAMIVTPRPTTTTTASASPTATIPLRYYVCDPGTGAVDSAVSDEQIREQTEITNRGYAGTDTCSGDLSYVPPKMDTGFKFVQSGIVRLTNPLCANDCANNIPELTKSFAKREDGLIKVVLCETQLLGIASFPGFPDSERILIVNPETLPGGRLSNYNLGKTFTHELGHYMGIFHTFQDGCVFGDGIADTNPELEPNYGCPNFIARRSCGTTIDPVHNFLDYSDDRCMCSFTHGQAEDMWRDLQEFQPDLLQG